jgi:hypothetical protein
MPAMRKYPSFAGGLRNRSYRPAPIREECSNCRPSSWGVQHPHSDPLASTSFRRMIDCDGCRCRFRTCVMESSAKTTAAVFAAYLRCPTEARLLMRGETPSHTFFSDMRKTILAAQRTKFETADLFGFSELGARPESETGTVLIDSDTSYLEARQLLYRPSADRRASSQGTIVFLSFTLRGTT